MLTLDQTAKFIADHIDASIVYTLLDPSLTEAEIDAKAIERLTTEGYQGRRYTFMARPDGKPWWPESVEYVGS